MFPSSLFISGLLCFGVTADHPTQTDAVPRIEHVVVLGLDGLSNEGLNKASTPNLDALQLRGVLLKKSRGVMPSKSAPNWASILTGVGPERHGIHSNQWWWLRWRRYLGYPTLFSALRRSGRASTRSAVIHEWNHFGKLWDPVDVDVAHWTKSASETMEKVDEALSSAPALMVVHLLGIDRVGHAKGWQSEAYLQAVSRVDAQVGALLALLEAKSLRQNTLIIIASDHGGIGTKHGGDTPVERLTPVILNGPSLREGFVIETETANVDLFSTIQHVLQLPTLGPAEGRILREIFVRDP